MANLSLRVVQQKIAQSGFFLAFCAVAALSLVMVTQVWANEGERLAKVGLAQEAGLARGEILHKADIRYGVSHPLASFEGSLDASHVASEVIFDSSAPEKISGSVVVDLLGFSSRNKARDNHARRSLQTKTFPTASLQLTGLRQLESLQADAAGGRRVRGSCIAELNLHGQRSDWPVEVELQWSADELVVSSSFTVLLDDFSIRRDKLFGMPIRNEVPVSVELHYRRR